MAGISVSLCNFFFLLLKVHSFAKTSRALGKLAQISEDLEVNSSCFAVYCESNDTFSVITPNMPTKSQGNLSKDALMSSHVSVYFE